MNPYNAFKTECDAEIAAQADDKALAAATSDWLTHAQRKKYSYHFEWLGRPIIQYPQDIVAMQEIIWNVQPDLIIETGIAHGGSLIFSASMLELIAVCTGSDGMVLGVDIDIRPHNRQAIESHPLSRRIQMITGSSVDPAILAQVQAIAENRRRVLVCLDSNHTHDHVLKELAAYAPMTSVGSYCVVFDTVIERFPSDMFSDRPWRPGNSPMTAVSEYLRSHSEFVVDAQIDHKLLISVAPRGYLKRVR